MFKDLLDETKGFKYQITLKVEFKKYKPEGEIEFFPVYFSSTTKIVINHKFSLKTAFQEILYRIDNWISEESGWIVEFPADKEGFSKIETKNNICTNVFCYENKLTFPVYIPDKKFENSIDLLLVIDENKSHYVYIKDFDKFMFHKTKNKNKKVFLEELFTVF